MDKRTTVDKIVDIAFIIIEILMILILLSVIFFVVQNMILARDNNALLKEMLIHEQEQSQQTEQVTEQPERIIIIREEEPQSAQSQSAVNTQSEEIADDTVMLFFENTVQTEGKTIGKDVELPDLPTDRKVCTDYRFYNIPGTPHNRMQLAAWTDEQGCRRYGDYYIVGLGSAYSDRVGETFEVELDTGVVFRIITGDMKPDDDTDVTNRFEACYNYCGEYCANVLEFIMDKEVISRSAYEWGGVDYYDNFKGNIVRMTYLGRDTSADWDIYT